MSSTSSPQRRTHLMTLWAELTAPVTMWTLASRRTPGHAHRLPDALLIVDDVLLGKDVQNALVGRDRHRTRGIEDPLHVAGRHLPVPNRHDAVGVEAADVAARDAGADGVYLAPGDELGLFDRSAYRLHRRLDVDDNAPLQAARGLESDSDDLDVAFRLLLADDGAYLGGADVQPHHEFLVVSLHASAPWPAPSSSRQRTANPLP